MRILCSLALAGLTYLNITTNHYSFTLGGAHVTTYRLVCDREACYSNASGQKLALRDLRAVLMHPKSTWNEAFESIVSERWLRATMPSQEARISRFPGATPSLLREFRVRYRNRDMVIRLLSQQVSAIRQSNDELESITINARGTSFEIRSAKLTTPFLLPFSVRVGSRTFQDYDPRLARIIATAISRKDPVRSSLAGHSIADFVGSAVWGYVLKK